jgi:hypothetical protein
VKANNKVGEKVMKGEEVGQQLLRRKKQIIDGWVEKSPASTISNDEGRKVDGHQRFKAGMEEDSVRLSGLVLLLRTECPEKP